MACGPEGAVSGLALAASGPGLVPTRQDHIGVYRVGLTVLPGAGHLSSPLAGGGDTANVVGSKSSGQDASIYTEEPGF